MAAGYFDGNRNVLIVPRGFMHPLPPNAVQQPEAVFGGQMQPTKKVTLAVPKQYQTDYSTVQLRGFKEVQAVFPGVPPREIVQALAGASSAPTSARAAAASRVLMARGQAAQVASTAPARPQTARMQRTLTEAPNMLRTNSVVAASPKPLPRTVTAPAPVFARSRSAAPSSGFPQEAPIGQSLAGDREVVSRSSPPKGAPKAPEQVEGLADFLRERRLDSRRQEIEKWCQESGAAFLDEIKDNLTDLAEALSLTEDEQKRFASNPLRPMPYTCLTDLADSLSLARAASADMGLKRAESTMTAYINAMPAECNVIEPIRHRQAARSAVIQGWDSNKCTRPYVHMNADMQRQMDTPIPSRQELQAVAELQKEALSTQELPSSLQVKCNISQFAGRYNIARGKFENEQPCWNKAGNQSFRIYSDADGRWAISGAAGGGQRDKRFRTKVPHNGRLPHQVEQSWNILSASGIEVEAVQLEILDADRCSQCDGTGFACRTPRMPCPLCSGTGKLQSMPAAPFQGSAPRSFAALQEGFLGTYGKQIKAELPGVKLVPTQVGPAVEQRFLGSMKHDSVSLAPAYHGTMRQNFDSIQEHGLLVPGSSGINVANGSAHGVGIYTAKLGASQLSKGFSRDSKDIFVCAVADDQDQVAQGHAMGNLRVHSETPQVRHVGNAMVVFDSARVVPLFIARCDGSGGQEDILSTHNPTAQQSTVLHAGGEAAGRGQVLVGGQKIWALPEASIDISAKKLRRRDGAKVRDVARRAQRDEKFASGF